MTSHFDPSLSKRTGVYCIRNLFDGKCYIGSTTRGFAHRWKIHLSDLRENDHHNHRLQRAWNECGEAAFEFDMIEECESEKCIEREQYWINELKPAYNICLVAGSSFGLKRGPMSIEHKNKIAKAGIGRPCSTETRQKRSLALIRYYQENGPHQFSEETRQKISIKGKGRKFTEEHKRRIGLKSKGRHLSEVAKQKISMALKGKKRKPFTKETILRMSKAAQCRVYASTVCKNLNRNV